MSLRASLIRLWPLRRPANPAAVKEFRVKGRPEVHRVEAGTPLADARDRGAVVLFEADDPGRYVLGRADNDQGKPIAMICGWTSYSKGHVSDALGNVVEKRVAVAWGWRIEEVAKAEEVPADEPGDAGQADRAPDTGTRRRPRTRPTVGADGGDGGAGAAGDGRARRKSRGAAEPDAAADVAAAGDVTP